jgi:nucleotide-binding universal stress UspA family protein
VVLEVENLEGVRPLAPRWEYGQKTTRIEALLPSKQEQTPEDEFAPGQHLWMGIGHFHVLTPGGIKVLVCLNDPLQQDSAVLMGCKITQAVGGNAAILSVVSSAAEMPSRREALESVRQQWAAQLPRLETRLRQGSPVDEIVREAQAGHYDLVVLGPQNPAPNRGGLGVHSIARQVLMSSEAAVLLVNEVCDRFERILVCTATGEPGKSDVLFSARLARHARAHVTVLHVISEQATHWARRRVEQHLAQAQASLLGLGIQCDTKISSGPVLETIAKETQEGNIDLVVIGAPDLHNTRPLGRPDLPTQIAERTNRPLLIVPMLR